MNTSNIDIYNMLVNIHSTKKNYNDELMKKCKKCNNVLKIIVRQTRKSDEGMTTFYICDICKKTFKN